MQTTLLLVTGNILPHPLAQSSHYCYMIWMTIYLEIGMFFFFFGEFLLKRTMIELIPILARSIVSLLQCNCFNKLYYYLKSLTEFTKINKLTIWKHEYQEWCHALQNRTCQNLRTGWQCLKVPADFELPQPAW